MNSIRMLTVVQMDNIIGERLVWQKARNLKQKHERYELFEQARSLGERELRHEPPCT